MRRKPSSYVYGLVMMVCALAMSVVNAQSNEFKDPVRLMAGGSIIDTGERTAHSGPCLADFDEDGLTDLLVGDFSGQIEFFKNVGTNQRPEYAEGRMLEAEGTPIKIKNW